MHILLGYVDGGFARHAVAAAFQAADGYDPGLAGGQGSDVAVIALAAPVAGVDEVLALADGLTPRGARLMLGGFGQDRAERIQADVSCAALGYRAGRAGQVLLVHDCAGTRGTSGGPVLTPAADGTWRVAGVQVAGNVDDVGGSAVPAATIRRLVAGP